ncbi:MAG TPA: DUF3006 domain-containing protein [Gemmatimonadaceae bacterium]|nr:DUF3006 domain-containing protein [Gemmatimonadaceae bacterium]
MTTRAEEHRWVVDSIEEFVASIEVDGAKMITVPLSMLPDSVRQGDVLAVCHERPSGGKRSVLTIEIDEAATKDALAKSAAQVAKHRKRSNDAGGDITL